MSTSLISGVDAPNNNDIPSTDRSSLVKHPTTPPSSHSDSSESTIGSSDEAYSPVPKRKKNLIKVTFFNKLIVYFFRTKTYN
jgi:hypothetical protein